MTAVSTSSEGASTDSSNDSAMSFITHSTADLVEISRKQEADETASGAEDAYCQLVFSKSKVYVYPSTHSKENIAGYVAIVQQGGAYLLSWIPERVVNDEEQDKFVLVEAAADGRPISRLQPDADSVLVSSSLTSKPAEHAFSLPITSIYSLEVRPPTLSAWYGTIVIHTFGGISLPPLYFHDDESPSTVFTRDARKTLLDTSKGKAPALLQRLPSSWGGEALINKMRQYANVIRSNIEPTLYLVNPNTADLEAHSTFFFDDDVIGIPSKPTSTAYAAAGTNVRKDARGSILHEALKPDRRFRSTRTGETHSQSPAMDDLTFSLLSSFSKLTRNARSAAQSIAHPILSHRLAKPILPHLPPPIANLYTAHPEWSKWEEEAGVGGYDAARVYLAKWSRIVAEEGERARRAEVGCEGEEEGALGAFEVLATTYSIQRPRTTRATNQPIEASEWAAYFDPATGVLLLAEDEARRRIFQRGLVPAARKQAWPFLLGMFDWTSSAEDRRAALAAKTTEYHDLRSLWYGQTQVTSTDEFIEENHRIEIDCRRTDRIQPMFAATAEEEQGPTSLAGLDASLHTRASSGGQPASNIHVRRLQEILLTYNFFETELGYVQGMSDLCSPLYVTFDADKITTFWCFVGLMERMKRNFLRDQSGMKQQLSQLQELIALMDPELYKHFDKTDSLNLFFCFRQLLILFKREFTFAQIPMLWENFWTDVCGTSPQCFFALAILQTHRDPIIRHLVYFDEVLAYINGLSLTMEVEPLLAQAEILYKTFQLVVEDNDRRRAEAAAKDAPGSTEDILRRRGALGFKDARLKKLEDEDAAKAAKPLPPPISDNLRSLLTPTPS
ncbi:uncharacterized protein L969DRAFT_84353 [Mixia osmundae IAM 14324]|uniref:Rab-GAP TBC domain-containing protein n=1 Tax=Mixia osmundae (strain CBS 9802 / IAM 14324 / JCM 22182 / KY 12970) TaxID=764103 RepID=G7E333_MIXOS|nr:uncharacterized protein L969DRAFT_84353 [Mixia osmundae IAM 14324]KEI42497.1 hypothetical protein L969DRAFT_84353 [Mixia osmundae IAM 14324]GAA97214.1 hypothetical protein E5Q_03890 [Mixia osmundae IAM 14324]